MNQRDFIHNKLFPLLTFHSRQAIHNYTAISLQKEKCIETLTTRKTTLQVEINNLEEALKLLNSIQN